MSGGRNEHGHSLDDIYLLSLKDWKWRKVLMDKLAVPRERHALLPLCKNRFKQPKVNFCYLGVYLCLTIKPATMSGSSEQKIRKYNQKQKFKTSALLSSTPRAKLLKGFASDRPLLSSTRGCSAAVKRKADWVRWISIAWNCELEYGKS